MTHEQSNRESQEAARMRQETMGQIYDGVRGVMADIHRRVIDEPWFGKTTQDVIYNQQFSRGDANRNVDQDPETSQEAKQEAALMESFYGKSEGQAQAQGPAQDRGIEP
jgi:hypothetical protein